MSENPQQKGGQARAKKLSAEERSSIAKKGAEARWSDGVGVGTVLERAQVANDLILGPTVVACAVLQDGTRVLSERGIAGALGRTRSGSHWQKKREHGAKLPLYLTADNLYPFISSELIKALSEPRWYLPPHGGRPSAGVPATCLPDICDVWIRADEAGVLRKPQKRIAAVARALVRAFAKTGIVALVDEATGYQEFRDKQELQVILAAYLSKELLPWAERFPTDYYKHMFRLWNWPWPPKDAGKGPLGPRYSGKLTNKLVYDHLPPGVADALKEKTPPDTNWQRRDRLHQHLSEEIGQPHLEKQVAVVTNIMKVCDDKEEFMEKFEKAFEGTFPKSKQLSLFRKRKKDESENN